MFRSLPGGRPARDFCLEVMPLNPYLCSGKRQEQKGTESFPSSFPMTIETQAQAVERMIGTIIAAEPQYFLVEVKIRPTNNIKVFLDGDKGIPIEKCVTYNRQLYKMIEESGLFPADDFSLEVSSPGLDEPLKLLRQYKKNTGRKVEVLLKDGVKTEGVLKEVTDTSIEVEETRGKGKKQETVQHHFPFESIKSTKIQIVF
jgi:ribosome maturation factor RimP